MVEEVGRSTRIRRKPLQFWNNERVRYNIHGDMIESSLGLSESSSQLRSSSLLKPAKNTSCYKKINNVSFKSKRYKPNKTLPNNYKENITNFKKGTNISKNRSSISNLVETNEVENEPPYPDYMKNRDKNKNDKRERNSSPVKKNAKKIVEQSDEQELPHSNNILTGELAKKKDKRERNNTPVKKNAKKIVEQSDEQELPHSNNILTVELAKKKDITVFQLTSMTEMRNEYDELFYLERGPFDVNVGLCTGFICLKSPTLHWGYCSASRKIFTMEGEGAIEFTHEKTGLKVTKPLFKGAKYDISGGGDILLTKEDNCSHMFLFVSFILTSDLNNCVDI